MLLSSKPLIDKIERHLLQLRQSNLKRCGSNCMPQVLVVDKYQFMPALHVLSGRSDNTAISSLDSARDVQKHHRTLFDSIPSDDGRDAMFQEIEQGYTNLNSTRSSQHDFMFGNRCPANDQ